MTPERKNEFYNEALVNAFQAANVAQEGMVEDMNAMDCGFAWVVVTERSFMAWCRKNMKRCEAKRDEYPRGSLDWCVWNTNATLYGSKHHAAGWCFWKPGNFNGQSVGIHEAGAKAFSETLQRELGTSLVSWSSRLD